MRPNSDTINKVSFLLCMYHHRKNEKCGKKIEENKAGTRKAAKGAFSAKSKQYLLKLR